MQDKEKIQALLSAGNVEEALRFLNGEIEVDGTDDELYYTRGNVHYKSGNWKAAMEDYMEAVSLNPDSPAGEAIKMAQQVLDFYNKDIYCQ